jgi:tRNA-2-methylthio-N6-dimethylallyladenosine synthase
VLARVRGGARVVETDYAIEDKFEHLPAPKKAVVAKRGVTAFLTVQEGCDKFCTFCVVPYTRGSEVSRPVEQIVAEAERLAAAGVREVTLLGQNVNAWHGEGADGREWGLGRLLFRLAEIPGIARLRYTTSHPRDMDDELIAAHRDLETLMPYLHLPVQAGSDRILKAMNRKHAASDYLRLIERIRAARPDIALSGDFIVGFPGETDADFEALCEFVREVRFDRVGIFRYSDEEGTAAFALPGKVPRAVARERYRRLGEIQSAILREKLASLAGAERQVLVDAAGPGGLRGRLASQAPEIDGAVFLKGDARPGDLVRARISGARGVDLEAQVVG